MEIRTMTVTLQPVNEIQDVYFVFGVAKDGFILQQNLQEVVFYLK